MKIEPIISPGTPFGHGTRGTDTVLPLAQTPPTSMTARMHRYMQTSATVAPRTRRAVYDPWRERPRLSLPPVLPTLPALLLGLLAIVLAFLIGRSTGGGGGGSDAGASVVATSSTTTTTLSPLFHTVQKGETL